MEITGEFVIVQGVVKTVSRPRSVHQKPGCGQADGGAVLTSNLSKKPAPRPWLVILSATKNLFFFGGSIHCKSRFFIPESTLERNEGFLRMTIEIFSITR